ncbi:3714_t:CDS:10 [Funneliformis geosporum]|nr:3714_t:CDS:10 [Funneliformis geosporum]
MADNEGRTCVYGLRHQARCLTAVVADSDHNKFLVGSQSLRRQNEIHLLDFREDEFEITSSVFQHYEEIWDIASFDSNVIQSKASLWRMSNIEAISEDSETNPQSQHAPVAPSSPLETIFEVDGDATVKKILWEPKKVLAKFASIHDHALNVWALSDQFTTAKLLNTFEFSSSTGPLTTGAWNPHQPEIAIGKERSISGWDVKSQSQTFNIDGAHSILVRALDFNPNIPNQIASAGDDCKVRFWDIRNTTESIKEISDHTHWIWAIEYNRFHDQLFLSSGSDCQVNLQSIVSISSAMFQYNEYDDNKSEDEYQEIISRPTDGLVRTYDQHEDSVYSVAWSAHDPWIFCSLSYDGRAVINRSIINSVIRKKLQGYVGFANLPNQVHRKSVKKGFHFTVMIVGESGLGKSTLVNTLFGTTLYPNKGEADPSDETPKTVEIQSLSADIEENGVKLRLTVVDTPGFGDFVNNEESWKPILENIEARFDAYLEQENRVNRRKMLDNRVHACIYFIAPTGHSLKPLDVEFMRRLHTKVNLIPVIAKSDTLTEDEIKQFKQRILDDIAYHKIQIYQAPQYEYDDQETVAENREIISKIPFAIVGSDKEVELSDGRRVRGRKYPWGVIEVDNEEHNDFVKLRQMLIRTHMEELKEYTNDVLYENYRSEKLVTMGVQQDQTVFKEVNPLAKMEEERQLHEAKLQKMEAEMKMVFQQKVQEKEAKLKQSEEELYARHKEMKDALEKQRLELEEKKRRLESGRPITPEKAKKKGFSFNK